MKTIGLTGGIGTGKTTVLKMFRNLGAKVYIADIEARKLMNDNPYIKSQIIDFLGENSYVNGVLNRAFIANELFLNPYRLNQINQIVHPAVHLSFESFKKKIAQLTNVPYIVYESALIFEIGGQDKFDFIITVTAPKHLRFKRIFEREGLSEKEISERMQNQWDDKIKVEKSDFVIENINFEDTLKKVELINTKIINSHKFV